MMLRGIILLVFPLVIVGELDFQEGHQGNRKFWDTDFCPFVMHPVRDFSTCIPYLALRSLSLHLQMQAAEAGLEKQHSKHKTFG